jgi:NAD+ kinase
MRLLIVANVAKPKVQPALDDLLPWLRSHARVIDIDTDTQSDLRDVQADYILVLGGDGTLLSVARRLHGRQLPVMGINYGRLGFLASFRPDEFKTQFEQLIAGRLPIGTRMMLEASVISAAALPERITDVEAVAAARHFVCTALNDAVLTAGSPFRMIELGLGIDGDLGVSYSGDGLIISTPSGSTAYNVSAGGPILNPPLEAFCITPICPHSLSFRPIVLPPTTKVTVHAIRVNEGTTLVCDGQCHTTLEPGDHVVIRRADHPLLLVENPHARQWQVLAEKLHWASSPRYTSRS